MPKLRKRHVPKLEYEIGGELQFRNTVRLIESLFHPCLRRVAAYSVAQARLLFAARFERTLGVKVFIGNAEIYQIGVLAPTTMEDLQVPVITKERKEKKIDFVSGVIQTELRF
ncbi:MAG: hypothetical protein Q8Q90_00550 [bacterium]|nr:hypothetical protein [bacterium]